MWRTLRQLPWSRSIGDLILHPHTHPTHVVITLSTVCVGHHTKNVSFTFFVWNLLTWCYSWKRVFSIKTLLWLFDCFSSFVLSLSAWCQESWCRSGEAGGKPSAKWTSLPRSSGFGRGVSESQLSVWRGRSEENIYLRREGLL